MKLVVIGIAGSGKTTQCELLKNVLHVPYFSMGSILRKAAAEKTKEGEDLLKLINSGALVDQETTIRLLKVHLDSPACKDGYILDGFPRDIVQLQLFPDVADKVIVISLSDEEATKRLMKRRDDRSDDTPETIATRLHLFHERTQPLIAEFRKKGMLIEVDGEQSIEKVHEDIIKALENL